MFYTFEDVIVRKWLEIKGVTWSPCWYGVCFKVACADHHVLLTRPTRAVTALTGRENTRKAKPRWADETVRANTVAKMNTPTQDQAGTKLMLTPAHAEAYRADNEGQRIAKVMLQNIARTLSGITAEQADAMRQEYCDKFPKARNETNKAKSSAREDKFGGNVIWPGDMVPPVLRQFNETADHVFKLRKLGALDKETPIAVNFARVSAKHAERFENHGK